MTQRDTSGSFKSGFETLQNGHKFVEENIIVVFSWGVLRLGLALSQITPSGQNHDLAAVVLEKSYCG